MGTGVRPRSETDFVVLHLFDDPEGRAEARQMDATIGELPGMQGCDIFVRAGRASASRRRLTPASATGMWRSTPAGMVATEA